MLEVPPAPKLRPQELLNRLGTDGALRDVRTVAPGVAWARHRGLIAVVEGLLDIDGRSVPVQVGLKADFTTHLPVISVEPVSEFTELPHIESDGAVCYRPQDEPLLDRENPSGIVREALMLVASTLRSVLHGDPAGEYASEIVAYWAKQYPASRKILSLINPDDRARIITAFFDRGKLITAADSPEVFAAFRDTRNVDHLTFVNALYVPVDPAGTDPSFHPRRLASGIGLQTYVIPFLNQDKTLWREINQHCRSRELLIVLGVERRGERRGLVGLLVRRGSDDVHPLDFTKPGITPVHIDCADRGFLAPRGGADICLAERKVLVIGCGAVGGHVIMNLARAGVGELHLMDPDEFEAANTFRHICGRVYVGQKKVVGLKLEIERLIPFASVVIHPNDVLEWMQQNPEGFRKFDLVVCAIGSPMVEMRVNEAIAADSKCPPVIFAWLEPFGLGGHVLVTHLGAAAGCFECLYARNEGLLACRTAFARPGTRYTRDMMGCGSQHMAYGDLDSQRTAGYASRIALEVLQGKAQGPSLLSWKGNAEAFYESGFKTTRRFDQSASETVLQASSIARIDCPACNRC